jgi:hypothetical protein
MVGRVVIFAIWLDIEIFEIKRLLKTPRLPTLHISQIIASLMNTPSKLFKQFRKLLNFWLERKRAKIFLIKFPTYKSKNSRKKLMKIMKLKEKNFWENVISIFVLIQQIPKLIEWKMRKIIFRNLSTMPVGVIKQKQFFCKYKNLI